VDFTKKEEKRRSVESGRFKMPCKQSESLRKKKKHQHLYTTNKFNTRSSQTSS